MVQHAVGVMYFPMNRPPVTPIPVPQRRRYRLADLLAQCAPNVPSPADLALWESAKPAGNEIIDKKKRK